MNPVSSTRNAVSRITRASRARLMRRRDVADSQAAPTEAPRERPIVVLIPALLIPSFVLWPLAWSLWRAGYRPRIFHYRSWWRDIPDNARHLAEFLVEQEVDSINIVAYSMGGILTRWAATHHEIPRLDTVIMIGPPNQGAWAASELWRRLGFIAPIIWGRALLQLRRGQHGLCERAGRLPDDVRVGIIAGGRGNDRGFNPLVPGDNDFTVGVTESLLPGMSDFALVRVLHTGLPLAPRTRQLALAFLQSGRFRPRAEEAH